MALKNQIRQDLFAAEYVVDLNATRAAIAAGYSPKGADVRGCELLRLRRVQQEIAKLQSKRASKLQIRAEQLDEECAKLAFANMGDYVRIDENGKPQGISLENITKDQWAAVQEIREDTAGGAGDGERKLILRTTLKLSDKTKNLELLYRRLGMLKDKTEHTVSSELAEVLSLARRRVENASSE